MSLDSSQIMERLEAGRRAQECFFCLGWISNAYVFYFPKLNEKAAVPKTQACWLDITLSFSYSSPSICSICYCFRSTHDGSSLDLKDQNWTHRWHPSCVYSTPTPHAVQSRFCHKASVFFKSNHQKKKLFLSACPMEQANLLHEADWVFHLFSLGSGPDASHVHCEARDRYASGKSTVL